MKLQVTEACVGHGRCYTLAPELLDSDDEGYVDIRGGDPIAIPEGQEQLADELRGSCPENAIIIIQD